jgi:carbamoylphosphate synthase large subunit
MRDILFGPKEDWGPQIRKVIDPKRYHAVFREFSAPDLAFEDFDCIVPLTLEDYRQLRAASLGASAKFILPDEPLIALADDKGRMNDFLLHNGFRQHIPEIFGGMFVRYPFIYKRYQDEWGSQSRIIYSRKEAEEFECGIAPESYFKQEYVTGNIEYIIHILAVRGKLRYTLCYEHTFDSDYFIKGKWAKYKAWRKVQPPFVEVFAAILETLDYTGTCCFNYKIANGVPKIFEMNPRFGATLTKEVNAYLEAYMAAIEEVRSLEDFQGHRFGAGSRNDRELDAAH